MNTHTVRTEIRAHREPWLLDRIEIRAAKIQQIIGQPREIFAAEPLKFRQLTESELAVEHEPTLSLLPSEAQQFMDELWRVGIRPTEGAGSVGQMATTEKHLEDMRRLVFDRLFLSEPKCPPAKCDYQS